MKNLSSESLFIPDFLKIQRESFRLFLKKGLIDELNRRNPIIKTHIAYSPSDSSLFELRFYSEYYRLTVPRWTPHQAILKKKNYASRVFVPVQLINYKKKKIYMKWILLATLPLMTKRGHFIINGSPRAIVNQIARGPGIYFNQTITKSKEGEKKTIYADIIPLRGTWLRLELDKNRRIWAKMKATPAIPALVFIQSLNIAISTILQTIEYPNWFKKIKEKDLYAGETRRDVETAGKYYYEYFDKEDYNDYSDMPHFIFSKNSKIACKTLAKIVYPKAKEHELSPKIGKDFLERKFMNSRIYDLGILGRLNLNKRFHKANLTTNQTTLTGQDVLFAVNELIKIYNEDQIVDDIDDLKNRRLRTAGELIQSRFAMGLIRLEKFITEQIERSCFVESKTFQTKILKNSSLIKLNKILIPRMEKLFTVKPINSALQEFFGLNPLAQFMDQTNPLAEITHKRRMTSLGHGGVDRETAGMAIRGIHPTHYGRICPIETPEGQNAGLVNSITTQGYIDWFGYFKTPFYKIYKGQVQRELGPLFLSSEQEKIFSVVPGDIFLSSIDILPGSSSSTNKIEKKISVNGPCWSFGPYQEGVSTYKTKNSKQINKKISLSSSSIASVAKSALTGSISSQIIKIDTLTKTKRIFSKQNQPIKYKIPIRHYHEFRRVFRETVNYMIISPIQMISIATSLIPFLEHDDANRALMGSNMQRQAVPLIYPNRPIVGTGLESRSVADSGQNALSPVTGLISYVSSNKIVIYKTSSKNSGFFDKLVN